MWWSWIFVALLVFAVPAGAQSLEERMKSAAGAYERKGNIPKAIEAYSGLLKYPPAQLPAHYQLGLWYAQIGNQKNARDHLEKYRHLAAAIRGERESPRFQIATRELKKLDQ